MAGPLHGLPPLPPPLPVIPACVKPPRPPNSWILYRAWKLKNLPPVAPGEARRNQSDVSSVVADLWRNEVPPIRRYFERLADEAKEDHSKKYPNYRYQPQKKTDKPKAKPKAPPRKKPARSSRGISNEVSTPAPHVVQSAHPYAHASRPAVSAYDRVGPSPPLSAASSPSPVSSPLPTLFSHSHPDPLASSTAVPAPSPYPSAVVDQSPYPPSAVDETYTLPSSAPFDTHQWSLVDQGLSTEYTQLTSPQWDQQPVVAPETQSSALYFDVPLEQNAGWTIPEFTCGHLSNDQHTFNCFLQDFPVAPSVEEQQGELEVSIGSLPSSMFPPSLDNLFPQDDTSLPFNIDPDFSQPPFDDVFFDGNNPSFNFEYHDDVSPNFATAPSEAPVEESHYVPPSGAAQSSTRRVAANWANYVRDMEESTEQYKLSV